MIQNHRKYHFIAAANLWPGDEILLVEQQRQGPPASTWLYRRQLDNDDELQFASLTR